MGKNTVINVITEIVNKYLLSTYLDANQRGNIKTIYDSLHLLLNGNYEKYHICNFENIANQGIHIDANDIQRKLSTVNERETKRKEYGVYYTPEDVTRYININAFINFINRNNNEMFNEEKGLKYLCTQNTDILTNLLFERIVLDPTCGAGEFLINAYQIKIDIMQSQLSNITDNHYLKILSTIKGNDINTDSTDISKIRLFLKIADKIDAKLLKQAAQILNRNFTNRDFVLLTKKEKINSDISVGNPPFVEYGKLSYQPQNAFGNIYADVIKNCIDSLKENGVFGLVIPLSYISTSRMQSIRNYVEENTQKEIILSFGDRPDCLFAGVHQKLCIVFGVKSRATHTLYTSNYRHWYKSERKQLLNGCQIIQNNFRYNQFLPKLGNEIEQSIFRKIYTNTEQNILQSTSERGTVSIYLNMRACFYVKAFTFSPGSNEYKKFKFDEELIGFVLCLLNSSLYFLFWTIISDCWHITKKELQHMLMPEVYINYELFQELSRELERKLETTKKYIGTKQTEYEYKHKECFDVLNRIDNALANVYNLDNNELDYVKNFDLKYRLGTGE